MIAIIDYGVGNLFSLRSSLTHLGLEAVVTADAQTICKADRLILPGVGAFADAMAKLEATGLVLVIKEEAERKPLLGICLGMQIAAIAFARGVLGYEDANSTEFAPDSKHPVIALMEEQTDLADMGGTMRLGAYPCRISPYTLMMKAYGKGLIEERHRHRYEFNNKFREVYMEHGAIFSGQSPYAGRGDGDSGTSVLSGSSVPSGVQEPPEPRTSDLPGVCESGSGGKGKKFLKYGENKV